MKKLIFILSVLTIVLTSSKCGDKDLCTGILCQNGGSCITGTCACAAWYEGTTCETQVRTKYFGDYKGIFAATGTSSTVTFTFETSSDGVDIIKWGGTQTLKLTSNTTFKIPLQKLYTASKTYDIEGSGSFSGSQVILNFNATANSQTTTFNFSGTK
jgi:hypothetical protein